MGIITIRDVLEQVGEFERALSDYYAAVAGGTAREGVRLLAGYMARHRIHLRAALDRMDPDRAARVAAAPLRYRPKAADCTCFEKVSLTPESTAEEVLNAAITLDDCLLLLYRQVLSQEIGPEVRELFASLLKSEERDQVDLKKIKALDYF